jgi:hypothetical protein
MHKNKKKRETKNTYKTKDEEGLLSIRRKREEEKKECKSGDKHTHTHTHTHRHKTGD